MVLVLSIVKLSFVYGFLGFLRLPAFSSYMPVFAAVVAFHVLEILRFAISSIVELHGSCIGGLSPSCADAGFVVLVLASLIGSMVGDAWVPWSYSGLPSFFYSAFVLAIVDFDGHGDVLGEGFGSILPDEVVLDGVFESFVETGYKSGLCPIESTG